MFEFLHSVIYIPNPNIRHANAASGMSKKILVLYPTISFLYIGIKFVRIALVKIKRAEAKDTTFLFLYKTNNEFGFCHHHIDCNVYVPPPMKRCDV